MWTTHFSAGAWLAQWVAVGSGPDEVAALIAGIDPYDPIERGHQADALSWLAGTRDIYRRVKPATPSPHVVSYAMVADPREWSVFLVDHRLAGLWLPAGGHVEPLEDPVATVRREAAEELGISADLSIAGLSPVFVTMMPTTGPESHTDVSLWFLLAGDRSLPITLDQREIAGGRWWSAAEVDAADPERFDPHLGRFLAKMRASSGGLSPKRLAYRYGLGLAGYGSRSAAPMLLLNPVTVP